jgi:enterochelin esterase family protein
MLSIIQNGPYVLGNDSQVQAGVPQGELNRFKMTSKIYPGAVQDYWIYVPAGYGDKEPASLMVFQDGWSYANPRGSVRASIVFDNLIHKKEIPPIIGVFVNPGRESKEYLNDPRDHFIKYPESLRADQYDVPNGIYAQFLQREILPKVEKKYKIKQDANSRAICGMSSGGLCAWTAAWERPDMFGKVLSHCGSFTDIRGGYIYPYQIRKKIKKPIRIFLQTGTNDLNCVWGDWKLANDEMASALEFKGYDYKYVIGDGEHSLEHPGALFPESLRWLWRD